MGADLYIHKLHEPMLKEWEDKFERAVGARDVAPDEASRQAAQVRVKHAFEQMFSRGYFRDAYNNNLLWKFGLSWWEDVIPMLDADNCLTPQQAGRLLEMLAEREPKFQAALAELKAAEQNFFQERYAELKKFLGEAIAFNEPIVCSL